MNDDRGVTEEVTLKSDVQPAGGGTSITHTHSLSLLHTHTRRMTDGSAHSFASPVLCRLSNIPAIISS